MPANKTQATTVKKEKKTTNNIVYDINVSVVYSY